MVLTTAIHHAGFALALLGAPQQQAAPDLAPVVRRLAATAQLAAQEYRVGVAAGKVISPAEVEEAQLFLAEARRSAGRLPPDAARAAGAELDAVLALVRSAAEPDSVSARVGRLTARLAQRFGVDLDEVPVLTPSLARGAEVFQQNCASCHGSLGRGNGPAAAGLRPPPTNLAADPSLGDRSPLDFFRRINLGVAGTAMPAFETRLAPDDRWAVALYASTLRLPPPTGVVPPGLRAFATTARLSDRELIAALGLSGDSAAGAVARVRLFQAAETTPDAVGQVFAQVRAELDSSAQLARAGANTDAGTVAFDAYMTFEKVERSVRAKSPDLATSLEVAFATLRSRLAGGATEAEIRTIRGGLATDLERAERLLGEPVSPVNLFVQSLALMIREGLEAILVVGALMAFLLKTGAERRRRDIHIGVGAAVAFSLVTAILIETIFKLTRVHQEALEGATMVLATVVLFYVSYWLLSKMEVAKWNRFVRSKVQDALTGGSALALASVAFLAVYREGFETVLFYKALFVAGGSGAVTGPIVAGMLVGGLVLMVVYVAINRFGVKIPLKPFFAVTSAFLYYMAFVFAGRGIAELQEGGWVSTTLVDWAPRIPSLGIYQTAETLLAQGVLVALLLWALVWTFVLEPRRLRVTSELVPEPAARVPQPRTVVTPPAPSGLVGDVELLRSLDRMDADLAELRAEIDRIRRRLGAVRQ